MFCVAPPELETKMNITKGGLVLFSANSNSSCMELSKKIAERLGVEMGKVQVYQEPNRETRVQIQESVRGKDVFIIQTVSKDVNTTIMELLIMVYACKTSCAKSIIGVIPYFPYSKQCKMRKRGSIVSKLLASMMCKAGLTHLITMDLHQKEIQGFFNIPVDNLRASPFLLQYIQEEIPDYRNAVIVAKSPASAKRLAATGGPSHPRCLKSMVFTVPVNILLVVYCLLLQELSNLLTELYPAERPLLGIC
ncbi:phosphoribosyl pyrophosphate synthase-associated protein 2 isoform X1 [Leptonychotes weddellii]|uniref:Phosphoribosyl pyrophosphate synthase-associated protein 2 n=1 Tax=Leptonychotes weddellii TaxID=9713 RepID=A0A7F8Q8B3_LEPWE|nr:phosphoribosyl pyrophosphate synthase-associated protein 2 isoform X1 [Leptonychotes weddellii]XP_030876786.1 phosphoribosyl pyrophosphate synthase-associated protein 2 isoform X1 [Leptonychotes weddellii]